MKISHSNLWVQDQDEALDYYTNKIGLEVRDDITLPEMGDYRWLTLGSADQPEVAIIVSVPSPPVVEGDDLKHVRELMAKGLMGGLHFTTDDCADAVDELKARGAEISQEPTEMPYGVDAEFRDPSGNRSRIVERRI